MTRHLLKLLWNRKRANLLIAIEILLSFIVLLAVSTLAVFYADNYRRPLGFDVEGIWTISVNMHEGQGRGSVSIETTTDDGAAGAPVDRGFVAQRARVGRLLQTLKDLPEVEAVAATFITPYGGNTWNSDIQVGGRRYRYGANEATDDFAKTMGLEVTQGRWFSSEDDGAAWRPVVINERLAREMFPDRDPVGQFIADERPEERPEGRVAPRMRVIGVIRDYRKDGEYGVAENFLFTRNRLDDPDLEVEPPRDIVVRVKPGTTAAFEERAIARLRAAEPDWTFQPEPLSQSRDTAHRVWLAPLAAAGLLSAFLLLMVALGLTGVLWLHVTQRTREVGLRRAKGATQRDIRRQIVGEVLLLTAVAVAGGVALVSQLPILGLFEWLTLQVYAISLVMALGGLFLLTSACAWVPARMASAVEPAEALRYE